MREQAHCANWVLSGTYGAATDAFAEIWLNFPLNSRFCRLWHTSK